MLVVEGQLRNFGDVKSTQGGIILVKWTGSIIEKFLNKVKHNNKFAVLHSRFFALPRFEIFEIYRARAEDNKIQRSDV